MVRNSNKTEQRGLQSSTAVAWASVEGITRGRAVGVTDTSSSTVAVAELSSIATIAAAIVAS
jgi:hypothetical protein